MSFYGIKDTFKDIFKNSYKLSFSIKVRNQNLVNIMQFLNTCEMAVQSYSCYEAAPKFLIYKEIKLIQYRKTITNGLTDFNQKHNQITLPYLTYINYFIHSVVMQ